MLHQLDVIITTRNRKNELVKTIDHLLSIGILQDQLTVTDDASTDGTAEFIKQNYPSIYIKEFTIPQGYINNRNVMMRSTSRPFCLSLDDDSHIRTREDLEEAILLLSKQDKYGVLTFKPFEQIEEPPAKGLLSNQLIEVKTYIGCGHILKRELIDLLGNYREEFEFYGEELDYSIRAYLHGFKVIMKNNLVVHHRVDWELRSKQLKNDLAKGVYGAVVRSKLGFSNHLIIAALYYPYGWDILFIGKYIFSRFYQFTIKRGDWNGFILGLLRFIKFLPFIIRNRNKMTHKNFWMWLRMPDFSVQL